MSLDRWMVSLSYGHAMNKQAQEGHWRHLAPGQVGHDQAGNAIGGKTWVSRGRLKPDVKLKSHQQDFVKAVKKLPEGRGIIAAHGTGTGKTVSSIAAFETMKEEGQARRALVVVPAGLRDNFLKKGVERFTGSKGAILKQPGPVSPDTEYVVVSYSAFRRQPKKWIEATGADVIIADEFHRAGNPESATHQALQSVRGDVKHFLGLTASISQNKPSDVVPLVNLAQGGRPSYESPRSFAQQHVRREPSPMRGMFGGKRYSKKLVKQQELLERIGPSIHYVEDLDATEKPRKDLKTVEIEMSSAQRRLYEKAMEGVDPTIAAKIAAGEPVSKREAANIFDKLRWARDVSNSLYRSVPGMTLEQAAERTPKIKKVLDDAVAHIKKTPDGQVIMYTNVVKGGVDVLRAGLDARGISYGVFAGKGVKGITEAGRQQDVEDYLAGKKRVIIITGAGAEGLSLGNTTMVQVVDGHYNPERIAQAEARGIRAGGLAHRPQKERKVQVQRYVSTLPKNFWQTVTFKDAPRSVDEWTYMTAEGKNELNKELRKILKARAVHEQRRRNSMLYRTFVRKPRLGSE